MCSSESEDKNMENVVRSQGAFSKRRTSLVRKAHEISVFCDVDVAIVTFSPSDHVNKFFSGEKIEDVLGRYIKLPSEKRYHQASCLEWKLRRMREYDHIRGNENKLFHLDNQIKNLELQIKKTTIELEILQINLKEFELENEENVPLARILFCERNLHHTLREIKDRKERLVNDKHPSIEQTRPQVMQRSLDRQTPFASNFRARNWKSQMLNSSLLMQPDLRTFPYSSWVNNGMLDQLYRRRRISLGLSGRASNVFGFNPLATTSYLPIHHHGNPYLTQRTAIPLAYPPIQTHPGTENLQSVMYGNSSIHQRIRRDPAIPYVPYDPRPLGALRTSNLYHQPIMPGTKDQQLRLGVLGSSSVGRQANNKLSEGQGNQMSASDQNNNPQNVASTVPPTSHLQVDPNQTNMLCNPNFNTVQNLYVTSPLNSVSPNYNTTQNSDVAPPLNSVSPNYKTVQSLDVAPPLNSMNPNNNTEQNLDTTHPLNSESPNYNTVQNLDVTPLLSFESPDYNKSQNLDMNFESTDFNTDQFLDVTPSLSFESPDYHKIQNPDATPPSNSESVSSEPLLNNPVNGGGDNVNNGNTENSSTNSNNTIVNSVTNEKQNYQEPESPNTIFFNSLLDEAAKEAGTNINDGNTTNDTNEKENPLPESPDTIFFNSLLNEHAIKADTSETAVNKEESNSMEWEGFVLPDNISLEDFEMLF